MNSKRLHSSPELETSRLDELSDDLLLLILPSLSNLPEIARTSILSRRWINLWRSVTCLDFDATTALPLDRLRTSHDWYIAWVNKVIEDRVASPRLPSVKKLRIQYELPASQGRHIDLWINFAIANRVETLHLNFGRYTGVISQSRQYKLSEESWYRAPSGLSSIKCLISLHLSCVSVSKQFIQFILSSCPLLEDLSLFFAGTYNDLDVSGVPPLRLRRLKLDRAEKFALTRLCAPVLTSFYLESNRFNPQKIDVPMLTDLTIGGNCRPPRIMKYLGHFWSYLPQLEKLDLIMGEPRKFRLIQMPEMGKLKYLKMLFQRDTDPILHRIINFINACPLLETFAFEILSADDLPSPPRIGIKQKWRKVDEGSSFKCLKVLELYGGEGKTIDQEVVNCIISKAHNLEKLTVNTKYQRIDHSIFYPPRPEIVEAVKAKANELCKGRTVEIEIS